MNPGRGDIVLVDFEPARRAEANKVRPAIVITNDQANEHGSSVVVVPLTSNTERIYPFQLFMPKGQTGLETDGKAQVELLRSVSRSRVGRRVGGGSCLERFSPSSISASSFTWGLAKGSAGAPSSPM